ncbi:MAG: NAD(P)H-dependent oxidoreductase, partial [Candidatus Spechtbacterales bacterium]
MTKVVLILGTARVGRQSERVALWMRQQAEQFGFDVDYIDVADHLRRFTGEEIAGHEELRARIVAAEAFIIVSPEYNAGYPGELKLFLDAFYDEYFGKPVAFVGVSDGPRGGARAVEKLRSSALAMQMTPVRNVLHFANMPEPFNEKGEVKDASQKEKARGLF